MSNPERRRRAAKYEGLPPEPSVDEPRVETPARAGLMATNTGVRLTCTMTAMIGLLALFLCHAEKESRVIRRFAVQSAALTVLHAACGAALLLVSRLLGGVPFLGMMVTLVCLLGYISLVLVLIVARFRMMEHAWQGVRFDLPRAVEKQLKRFY